MPLAASHLNDPAKLAALKKALLIDHTSPTYLKWAPDYFAMRANPGMPAGGITTRQDSYVVTANKIPVHCRHAVWMLANDRVIPEGFDVAYADGDFRNLHPSNLVLVRKDPAVRLKALAKPGTDAPTSVILTVDDAGIWRVLLCSGKTQRIVAVANSAVDAASAASVAAYALGYVPAVPAVSLAPVMVEYITVTAKRCITLDSKDLRFAGARMSFLESLSVEMKRVLTPVPVAAPVAAPQVTSAQEPLSDDGREVLALIEGGLEGTPPRPAHIQKPLSEQDVASLAGMLPATPAPPPFDPLQTLE
jgi:hypothetical protein